jgi:hypothetical protein
MIKVRHIRLAALLGALSSMSLGCGAQADSEATASIAQAVAPGQCNQATAKDTLIAGFVKDSWLANYPLSRLSVDASGAIVGPNLPAILVGDLEVINSVADARDSIARALGKSSGLPDYGMNGMGPDSDACVGIPAWTPSGSTTVSTTANEVFPTGVNAAAWRTVHKEFGKECPLIKRLGNRDIIDPPGDGSTNAPASASVSATGVTANAYGICPSGTLPGTYCKLSYATGTNYTGRKCQDYYGSLRCLVY